MSGRRLLALVGFGHWGANIARALATHAPARWGYLVELRADRRMFAASRYRGVQMCADYDSVLADSRVAGIVIATPATTHAALAMKALAAGKHVFVEKPLAVSVTSAVELARAAQRRQLSLMVGHIFRYVPAVRKARELIDGGELGEIHGIRCERLDWHVFDSDVDALWDLGPHDISIVNHLLGDDPAWVTARCLHPFAEAGKRHVFEASMGYPCGVVANVRLSRRDRIKTRRIRVTGSRKVLVYDDLDADHPVRLTDSHGTRAMTDVVVPHAGSEPLAVELLHFLSCMDTGLPPDTDGWEGVRAVSALAAAEESWRQAAPRVRICVPPEAQRAHR